VKGLLGLHPDLQVAGIGGDKMRRAGMELLYHVREMSFMGFVEVIKHLPFILRVRNRLEDWVDEYNPDAVVLIDYPGFNLRFAKRMKHRDIPVYYYISPQVWAWGRGRLKKMKRLVDKMYVIFPFEEELYEQYEVPVEFVGHPLVEEVKGLQSESDFFRKNGLDNGMKTIGLLPGSREQEIDRHLEPIMESIPLIQKTFDRPLQFVLAAAPDLAPVIFTDRGLPDEVRLVRDKTYEVMKYSDVIITSSGSATLEVAYFGTPMVILYRMSTLTWWLGNLLVDMPYIGLANIVAEKEVVPELLQNNVNPKTIAQEIGHYLTDEAYYNSVKESLGEIREKLGEPGAGHRVAQSISTEIYPVKSENDSAT